MTVVGLIPAAGYGTRLGLPDGSKEMVSVGHRPVVDYLIERMRMAAPASIRLVTRSDKYDLITHAQSSGLDLIEGLPKTTGESIALGIDGLDHDDVVLLGFPDSIWQPLDGFRLLLDSVIGGEADAALGLFTVDDPETADVVLASSGQVEQILVKPSPAPANQIWACAAIRKAMLEGVERYEYPGELLQQLVGTRRISGVWLSDSYIDVGTRASLAEARRQWQSSM